MKCFLIDYMEQVFGFGIDRLDFSPSTLSLTRRVQAIDEVMIWGNRWGDRRLNREGQEEHQQRGHQLACYQCGQRKLGFGWASGDCRAPLQTISLQKNPRGLNHQFLSPTIEDHSWNTDSQALLIYEQVHRALRERNQESWWHIQKLFSSDLWGRLKGQGLCTDSIILHLSQLHNGMWI